MSRLPAALINNPAARRWMRAPGVLTGYYLWAKRPGAERAHCYRLGRKPEVALCGYGYGNKVVVPEAHDQMCEPCAQKAKAMERAMVKAGPKGRLVEMGMPAAKGFTPESHRARALRLMVAANREEQAKIMRGRS